MFKKFRTFKFSDAKDFGRYYFLAFQAFEIDNFRNFLKVMYLGRFRNRSMKQNCKQSLVMINYQQDKMEIPFDVEIPILIDKRFSISFLYSSTFTKFLSLPNLTIRVLVTGKRINRGTRYGLEIDKSPSVGKEKLR